MAYVIIELRIMPDSVEINLEKLQEFVTTEIKKLGGNIGKIDIKPIAFGLKSIDITYSMDEKKGGTDELEKILTKSDDIQNVQVLSVRRALG